MRLHSPALLFALTLVISCGASDAPRKYEVQPAFEFLFQRQQIKSDCLDRIPGQMRATGNLRGQQQRGPVLADALGRTDSFEC